MECSTRPSNVRVCQFRHFRIADVFRQRRYYSTAIRLCQEVFEKNCSDFTFRRKHGIIGVTFYDGRQVLRGSAVPGAHMNTDKLLRGNFAVFNHYLFGDENWVGTTNALDVERLAERIAATGASRYFITMMQGSRYMLAPNATYDEIAGTRPGEACAVRDVPMELGRALEQYGIDLYLYYTGDGPYKDPVLGERFGLNQVRDNMDEAFVARWASVLREYSLRYGDLVKGWWIDGCYNWLGYNDELLKYYHAAAKAGNPDSLVATNGGVPKVIPLKRCSLDEYTCGEFNDFTVVPESRYTEDGAQMHILAPLGSFGDDRPEGAWHMRGLKRDAGYLADYIRRLKAVGCSLTIDIYIDRDGSFDDEQAATLSKVSELLGQ